MNRIFPLSVCFYIIQNQGYSIKCLIKKFPAMLEREIWGNTLEDWGISILIILGTIVLMKLISFLSRKVLNPFITRTNNRLARQVCNYVIRYLDSYSQACFSG